MLRTSAPFIPVERFLPRALVTLSPFKQQPGGLYAFFYLH
jgi:hypothetical protein